MLRGPIPFPNPCEHAFCPGFSTRLYPCSSDSLSDSAGDVVQPGRPHASNASGASTSDLNALISSAPSAPSIER